MPVTYFKLNIIAIIEFFTNFFSVYMEVQSYKNSAFLIFRKSF